MKICSKQKDMKNRPRPTRLLKTSSKREFLGFKTWRMERWETVMKQQEKINDYDYSVFQTQEDQ